MPNNDFPRGLWAVRSLSGGEIRTGKYIAATSATIYMGDVVTMQSNGTVQVAQAGDTAIGVASEYKATTTSGVEILVYDDPNIVFGVQATTAAATDVGANAGILATTGNTTTKVSKHELNGSTITPNAAELRIMGKINTPDNDWGADVKLEVMITDHFYRGRSSTGV